MRVLGIYRHASEITIPRQGAWGLLFRPKPHFTRRLDITAYCAFPTTYGAESQKHYWFSISSIIFEHFVERPATGLGLIASFSDSTSSERQSRSIIDNMTRPKLPSRAFCRAWDYPVEPLGYTTVGAPKLSR